MTGKFIVIEGLDGTGKTTQIALVAERLRAEGYHVHVTAEPTKAAVGRHIREVLGGRAQASPWELACLFLADRIGHNNDPADGLQKHLADGDIILCDRYYYSTFAYQGTDTDLDWAMQAHFNCPEVAKPDLCIFLTMSPEACLERIHAGRDAAALEIFENTASLTRIGKRFADVFAKLRARENVVQLDAAGTIPEVTEKILCAIRTVL